MVSLCRFVNAFKYQGQCLLLWVLAVCVLIIYVIFFISGKKWMNWRCLKRRKYYVIPVWKKWPVMNLVPLHLMGEMYWYNKSKWILADRSLLWSFVCVICGYSHPCHTPLLILYIYYWWPFRDAIRNEYY